MEKTDNIFYAWVAGFFEGEGYVGITQHSQTKRFLLSLSIRQCDKEPLQKIQSIFGGSLVIHRPAVIGTRTSYSWNVQRKHALKFLLTIQPYLIRTIIKNRVAVAIEFQKFIIITNIQKTGVKSEEYNNKLTFYYKQINSFKSKNLRLK